MLKIIFEFVGGPNDGKLLQGALGDAGDAERYYLLTNHGTIGQRFKAPSDYAVETLAREHLKTEKKHHFQPHYYVVTDRIEEADEVLVRAEYVEKAAEKGAEPSARQPAGATSAGESPEQRLLGFLAKTAKSIAESYSNYWPAGGDDAEAIDLDLVLHLAHVLIGERFSVFAQAKHPDASLPDVDLLGIAPSQDWFAACELVRLRDASSLPLALRKYIRLETFWLNARLTAPHFSQHVLRVASHCETGYALVAGLHWVWDQGGDAALLQYWRSGAGPAELFGEFSEKLAALHGRRAEPITVKTVAGLGACYLLGAVFPIPRPQ